MILGGAAFSPDALRRQWGDELADEFERQRQELEAEVYSENPGLRDRAATLVSEGAFAEALERESETAEVTPQARDDGLGSQPIAPPRAQVDATEIHEEYARALIQHETHLFDAALERFSERRFAQVALAGRVPVKVDASFGSIEAGDPLTASPIPGVAMKARDPGWIVGTALESMPSGSGTILAFVDRHWFGGDDQSRLAALASEVEALRSALSHLALERPELRAALASQSQNSEGR